MGKSMVSCRFSLKPIHWSKEAPPHSVRLIDQRGSVNKDFSCQLNLRQSYSHVQKRQWVGGRNGFCVAQLGWWGFLGYVGITWYYLYDVLTHKGCKMRQVIINQAWNLEIIFIAAGRCQEDTGALHKLLACGLMDTDLQDGTQGSLKPGKDFFAISMTHGILL